MNKKIIIFLVAIFAVASSYASIFEFLEHEHGIDHAAPVDSNNCHYGSAGYHCHR